MGFKKKKKKKKLETNREIHVYSFSALNVSAIINKNKRRDVS